MFELVSEFEPRGDQPQAIDQISTWIQDGEKYRTLLGATGTGKTFTMANVIAKTIIFSSPALLQKSSVAEGFSTQTGEPPHLLCVANRPT